MLGDFFFLPLSRILTLEKNVLAILFSSLHYSKCHACFHNRKLDGYFNDLPCLV